MNYKYRLIVEFKDGYTWGCYLNEYATKEEIIEYLSQRFNEQKENITIRTYKKVIVK